VPAWTIILIRSLFMFLVVTFLLRLIGRKQTSQMTYSDFVTGIAIGGIAAIISLGLEKNLAYAMIAFAVWLIAPLFVSLLSMKSKMFHDIVYGRQTVLIKNGKIMEANLKEVRYTGEELLSQLRRKNIFSLADVEFAVMESNGEVSVMLKSEQTPITPKQLDWPVGPKAEPQTVILDGNIIDEGLKIQGLTRNWLQTELEKTGVALENVFIGQVDSSGDLYVDLFDDIIQVPKPTTKDLLYATLKKCEADLELYALGTNKTAARAIYQQTAAELAEVAQDLKPLLKR
jgi:uncharacterized membrane protein YcaP (DUF421 family)